MLISLSIHIVQYLRIDENVSMRVSCLYLFCCYSIFYTCILDTILSHIILISMYSNKIWFLNILFLLFYLCLRALSMVLQH